MVKNKTISFVTDSLFFLILYLNILLCLLGILLVIVEMSITNYIDIFNVSFNLVIIYITIISLYLDKTEVSIIGAIIGLVKDMAIGGIFGVNGMV